MDRTTRVLALTFSTAFFMACGGDSGTGPPANGDDDGNGGTQREIKADPGFAAVVQDIFDRKGCSASSCHGSAQSGDLDLRAGSAHGNLVNVQAVGEPSRIRVIPGNAQNSYLVIKLEGRQSFGGQMPLGGSPLDNIDLTNVRNWIDKGAKNN